MNAKRATVMLLVDADNVSADVMEQAMEAVLRDHGAAHIRRAYCTPESALKNATLFKRLSLRPMVNLSTGKNATDIALAIDALDLAIAERPDVAVIVSSDSDFAPLVIRLREKGCRVEGIGQQGKTGEASKGVYDAFLDLVHRRAGSAAARSPTGRTAPVKASRRRSPTATPNPEESVDLLLDIPATDGLPVDAPPVPTRSTAPARKTPARSRGASDAPSASGPTPPPIAPAAPSTRRRAAAANLPEAVQAILKAVPPLAAGQPVALGIAAERLRAAGLLARNAASTRLFARHARHFVLAPAGQPNTVQFVSD